MLNFCDGRSAAELRWTVPTRGVWLMLMLLLIVNALEAGGERLPGDVSSKSWMTRSSAAMRLCLSLSKFWS